MILAPLLDIVKNFFPAWFEWITGKPLMEFPLVSSSIINFMALALAGIKYLIIDRNSFFHVLEIVKSELKKNVIGLEKLSNAKRYSREDRKLFDDSAEKLKNEMKVEKVQPNVGQRLTIYFGLVVYHVLVSYAYAWLAGGWMS
ncbi:MAG: hypothetical protein D6732_21305 [Methanobacteriota archaeon]|nr:MAG: hypothetical protein D6732_21305 [Euryarchaeota archaeon]